MRTQGSFFALCGSEAPRRSECRVSQNRMRSDPPLSRGEVGNFSDVWETGRNLTVTYRLPTRVVAKEIPENAVIISNLGDFLKGGTQIRTGDKGFAILCLTTWPCRRPGTSVPIRGSYQPCPWLSAVSLQRPRRRPDHPADHPGRASARTATPPDRASSGGCRTGV